MSFTNPQNPKSVILRDPLRDLNPKPFRYPKSPKSSNPNHKFLYLYYIYIRDWGLGLGF